MKKNYFFKTNVGLSILAVLLFMAQATAQFENYTGAVNPNRAQIVTQKPVVDYSDKYLPPSGREGGETIATAIPIAGLPFNDSGNTCDNINDYDEVCPYSGSTAPDVVYSYTPAVNRSIRIDLCGSSYDTKVYVYENIVGNLVACNDDFYYDATCGNYTSLIAGLPLTGGNTYYIVVDGYGGACGDYNLAINIVADCFSCLPCSTPEGEPDILDNGVDVTDGGCNMIDFGMEPLFIPVQLNQAICGRTNTYNYFGAEYRDTDWYEITLTEAGTLYWAGYAPIDLQLFILGTNCGPDIIVYGSGIAGSCNHVTLAAVLPAGTYYLWAGPSLFNGLSEGVNYNVMATLNAPPPANFCDAVPPVPVSNWALYIGIGLILVFTLVRFRKMV
jgi:hypothetical protein